jgi:hypothetical protein
MKKLTERESKTTFNPKRRPVGRPNGSGSVRVVPVFRDEVDVRKLGRAALKLVMEMSPPDNAEEYSDEP